MNYQVGNFFVIHGTAPAIERLGYGMDDLRIGVRFPAGDREFSILHNIQTGSGAKPTSHTVGTEAVFPRVKRQEREADQD
jgi:hypothetical protein